MSCSLHYRLVLVAALVAVLALPNFLPAAEPTDQELLAGADARIEQCRKADATVAVVDAVGKPVAGAKIEVQQTRHAFLFGCNIFLWGKLPDKEREQAYRQRFAELLNYATVPFYWQMYEPQRGNPQHAHAEEVAQWCRSQGIMAKGHPLAWNHADPAWLPADAVTIHDAQMARIDDCVKRFRGQIDRWDVVNEVTAYDRDEFAKHTAPKYTAMWKKYGQIALPRECFLHARQANPQAVLLINDYRTDPGYERVIEQLVDEKGRRLYDVIGIQSHMHGGAWSTGQVWKVCQQFARFGVPLHFTETTILSGERTWDKRPGSPWPSTPEGEAYQAREATRFYTMLFSHPAVAAVTWWDFSDLHSWKNAPAGFLRKDMTPKPVYDALKQLIKGKWWTRTEIQSGPDGTAGFRGFLGDYQLTVSAGGKTAVVKALALEKGKTNRWVVVISAAATGEPSQPPALPFQQGKPHAMACADYSQGKIFLVSPQGKVEWEYPAASCDDLWVLPNGNLLFVTGHGVKEVTRDKKIVFCYQSKSEIYACQRLPNGDTFIAECNAGRLLEVDPSGKDVKQLRLLPEGQDGGHLYMRNARRLPNGHYLVTHFGQQVVKEYDAEGKVVMEISAPGGPHSVVRLPNGNTLIACGDMGKQARVFEADKTGKTVWQVASDELPGISLKFMTGLQRLPNGNTVMTNWLGHGEFGKAPHVIEVTPDKKVVWTFADHKTMKTISSIQLLDVPGDVTKGEIAH